MLSTTILVRIGHGQEISFALLLTSLLCKPFRLTRNFSKKKKSLDSNMQLNALIPLLVLSCNFQWKFLNQLNGKLHGQV